jgi:DNA-binding NtrC family response regulator
MIPAQLPDELEEAVARWFWQSWVPREDHSVTPQDAIEAYLLRTCLRLVDGSISEAAKRLDMHPETFVSHLEKLGDPEVSRMIRHDALAPILERGIVESTPNVRDRILRVLLTELLVYCRGNKTEMARHLGWGRQTLGRHMRRLDLAGGPPPRQE